MPGESVSGPASRPGVPVRLLRHPQRAILDALMALAAVVLERRIRRALSRGESADATQADG